MPGGGIELLLVALVAALLVGAARLVHRRETAGPARPRRRQAPTWLREAPVSNADAERRSLELLRSCVNPDEWAMYRDLGFICVTGRREGRRPGAPPRYRYLIYPHLPVVALLPRSLAPVREYCIQFPEGPSVDARDVLPTGDDVLAKWMTLRSGEDRLLAYANVGSPGCQVPLSQIERDVERYRRWMARTPAAASI
jgi:hypothetical protein